MAKSRVRFIEINWLGRLYIGGEYMIHHKRKGCIVGTLMGVVPGDAVDGIFLDFDIDVSDGSGSEWLRRAHMMVDPSNPKMLVPVSRQRSHLRPSLITRVELLHAPNRQLNGGSSHG